MQFIAYQDNELTQCKTVQVLIKIIVRVKARTCNQLQMLLNRVSQKYETIHATLEIIVGSQPNLDIVSTQI